MTDFPPTLRALPEQRTDEESVEDCGCLDAKGVLESSCKLHMASFRYWRVFSQQRKLMGSFDAEELRCARVQAPGQVQRGSREGFRRFRRRSGRLWCQQDSGEGSGEGSGRLWCRASSGSTGFRRRFRSRSGRLWSTLRCFQRLASQHA